MSDLEGLEKEAEGHERQVEEGVEAETAATEETGAKHEGLAEQAARDVEKQLGGQQGS